MQLGSGPNYDIKLRWQIVLTSCVDASNCGKKVGPCVSELFNCKRRVRYLGSDTMTEKDPACEVRI